MKFQRNSQEFLEINFHNKFLKTESQNCDPKKMSNLGDQFWGISRVFLRNQLQEMILEKFLRNSSKKVTTVGESGEIPHFCYLGQVLVTIPPMDLLMSCVLINIPPME